MVGSSGLGAEVTTTDAAVPPGRTVEAAGLELAGGLEARAPLVRMLPATITAALEPDELALTEGRS